MIKQKIGIIGGTFDPIHYGHLLAANEACKAFGLSSIIFIPTGEPPHKNHLMTSAEDRYMMVALATVDCPYFSVSRIEIDRPGKSYTADTLKALRRDARYADAEFFFIVGVDALMLIETWKEPRELLTLCKIIASSRPGYSFVSLKNLPGEYRDVIRVLEIPHLDISSTDIRERLSRGYGAKFLIPPSVESYIEKQMLYKNSTPGG